MSISLSVQGLKSLTSKVFFATHKYFALSLPRSGRLGAPACLAVTVLALFLCAPAVDAAVIMESNGTVTSIGVPKGEGRADPSAPTEEMRDAAPYPGLPWGMVPELHIPWPSSPHGGWQRPAHGTGMHRTQHGDGRHPSRRPGQRPPQTGNEGRAE